MKLISDAYIQENARLHEANEGYGSNGGRWVTAVIFAAQKAPAKTILDYGCGKGALRQALSWYYMDAVEYDPAIPGKDMRPEPADLVVANDVLEHIEPEYLDNVLRDLHRLSRVALFAVISTRPAGKLLPDGRNTHLIVQNGDWWRGQIEKYFVVRAIYPTVENEWVGFMRPIRMVG